MGTEQGRAGLEGGTGLAQGPAGGEGGAGAEGKGGLGTSSWVCMDVGVRPHSAEL